MENFARNAGKKYGNGVGLDGQIGSVGDRETYKQTSRETERQRDRGKENGYKCTQIPDSY